MKQRLFVYGSLGPGGPNEHVLSKFGGAWSEASVRGSLRNLGWGAALGFPALQLDASADPVPGYLFESAGLADHWSELDSFEGDEYRRVMTEVRRSDGSCVDAYVYVLAGIDEDAV